MKGSDNSYGSALMVGVGLMAVGLVMGGIFFIGAITHSKSAIPVAAASGLFILVFVAGLVLTAVTLILGLRRTSAKGKPAYRYDNSKVIARYVVNGRGETIFDEFYVDVNDLKLRFNVRLEVPG